MFFFSTKQTGSSGFILESGHHSEMQAAIVMRQARGFIQGFSEQKLREWTYWYPKWGLNTKNIIFGT